MQIHMICGDCSLCQQLIRQRRRCFMIPEFRLAVNSHDIKRILVLKRGLLLSLLCFSLLDRELTSQCFLYVLSIAGINRYAA
jgi:hypothetical protein